MNLLTVHFSKQLRLLSYNNINDIIRRYNHASNKKCTTSSTIKSEKFPDYKIIYMFPYAIYPYILNKLKRNYTVGIGALIPVTVSLQMLDFMSSMENLSFTACNCLLVLMLHTIGFTCNNLVGTIYMKDKDDLENQDVIISYINYWGKRIDLKTTVDDIIPFTENMRNTSNSLYKILSMKSCKQKLKVYIKYGKITEEASFSNIFG
ncbi:transmembrane protein 186-like [Bombus affinis]|uniref:transmembrane protein 186-like n=1 Tax=Bombus affinis TaxID=309941 RepID=UPI0021B76A27|nr:transmembrane protein 186-like [Bombus affinis]